MDICCEDGHDQVVFDGRECPICPLVQDLRDAEARINELEQKLHEAIQQKDAPPRP